MKKQVLFVHGGNAYDTYEDFIAELQTFSVDPYTTEKKKWRMSLKEDLGSGFEVLLPEMPNKQNAKYGEWKVWMDKYLPFLHDGVILVGHSLGGVFLVKYLSEETFPIYVKALYLISAPFFTLRSKEGGDFRFTIEKFATFTEKVKEIVIFHAKDDTVVPFSHAESYKAVFPDARFEPFAEGGHFVRESFPELTADIRVLPN